MVRIIPICSALALVLGGAGCAIAAAPTALGSYGRARMADMTGASDLALEAYSAALTGAPGNVLIAMRAYRKALLAGDKRLALRAAQLLDGTGVTPPDARILMFSDTLARGDFAGARGHLAKLEAGDGLAFLAPSLRGWLNFAAKDGDPIAALDSRPRDSLALAYAREQRTYLLLAMGRNEEGLTLARTQASSDSRGISVRLAAAARLATNKNRDGALSLLQGDASVLKEARALLNEGKPLSGAIDTAPKGVANVLARVSLDLMRDNASPAALTLARLASLSGPPEDSTRVTLAQALSLAGEDEAALAELERIPPTSLLADSAADTRISVLQRAGRSEEAETLAGEKAKSGTASDLARHGDALSRISQPANAAAAYEKAITRMKADGQTPPWNLWLLYGGALEAAKDWSRAKPALQRAVELAPDQPEALNHLGYAMLDRGENLEEATRLIAKANALRPDDPAISDSLGWAWFKRGDMSQSIPVLEAASAAEPTISEIAEHLGDAYWTAGRRVDARYSWRAALVQAEGEDQRTRLQAKIADGLPTRRK